MNVVLTVCINALLGLQTDHKALMKDIEQELYRYHEQLRQQNQVMAIGDNGDNTSQHLCDLRSFAQIDRVDANSPAEAAVGIFSMFKIF